MSNNEISITVPMDYHALTRASDMLHGLALDCQKGAEGCGGCGKDEKTAASSEMTVTTVTEPATAQPAETAASSAPIATTSEAAQPATVAASAGSSPAVDTKGVPFNAQFCANAQDPFYSSGKRSGQWKKGRGVDDAAYDNWYAAELAQLGGSQPAATAEPAQVNTAAAFGNDQQQQRAASVAPQDTGSFMAWISEKQAAGLLTQDDITAAYAEAGVNVADLFPPNTPEDIAARIAGIFNTLSAKAGA